MSGIGDEIQVDKGVSVAFRNITASIDVCAGAMYQFKSAANTAFDTAAFAAARVSLSYVNSEFTQMSGLAASAANAQEEIGNAAKHAASGISSGEAKQEGLNSAIAAGAGLAEKFSGMIKSVVQKFVSLESIGEVLNVSDVLANNQTRLNGITGDLQQTKQLQEQIFSSAEASRGSYLEMSAAVAELGTVAGSAFSDDYEMVDFAEQVNKQMKISGATTEETNAAMSLLTQSMGEGGLSGEQFMSIMGNGPTIVSSIADYMGVSTDKVKELAAEGAVTSDVIKNAVLGASASTDAAFANVPTTWGEVWTSFKNNAIIAFQPVLEGINEIVNSERFQGFVGSATEAMAVVGEVAGGVFDVLAGAAALVYDNWDIIAPILYGVAAAVLFMIGVMGIYNLVMGISNVIKTIAAIRAAAHGIATAGEAVATAGMTTAQMSFNAALLACPLTWILLIIIAVILVIIIFAIALVSLCNQFLNTGNVATTVFGKICGAIAVVMAAFINLKMLGENIFFGLWEVIKAVALNIAIAFQNSLADVKFRFYSLAAVALTAIGAIVEQLNNLPFIELNVEGIHSQASEYASEALEAQESKKEFLDIYAAWEKGFNTNEVFQDGWEQNAYDAGAAWGDEKWNSKFKEPKMPELPEIPEEPKTPGGMGGGAGNNYGTDLYGGDIAGSSAATADNTSNIADSLEVTNEELKYLRDIAERDAINRFTTAEIKVEAPVSANVASNMDLDGIVEHLANSVNNAMLKAAGGVHY